MTVAKATERNLSMSTINMNNAVANFSSLSSRNIYASFDAKKVEAVLNNANDSPRRAFYESMGVKLENVHDMETALKVSGLDFEVKKLPLFHGGVNEEFAFKQIPEFFATVRSDNEQVLGIVGKNYEVLQNLEAFNFLNSLAILGDSRFETAGNLKRNGAASYVTMSTEPLTILDDEFDPFMIITNGFDGGQAIKVAITPIRATCRNTAILALKKASFSISIKHTVNMRDNMERAKEVLLANTHYLEALKEEAEKLATTPFSKETFEKLAHKLYPVKEDASDTVQIRNLYMIERLLKEYKEDDLANFTGTAWAAIQAVSAVESHPTTWRKMKNTSDSSTPEFQVAFNMMPLLNKAYSIVKESV